MFLPIETGDREYEWLSDTVAKAHERYPDKVIPFCHVDVTRKDAVAELERRAALDVFRGYGEQKQHVPLDHPGLERVLAFCNEMRWPFTWHFQEGSRGYNQGIGHLETLVRKFREIRFIGHAQSWWANISAEVPPPEETLYPRGQVVPGGLADRLLSDYENVYADLSAGSGLGAITRDEGVWQGLSDAPPAKAAVRHRLPLRRRAGRRLSAWVFRGEESAVSETDGGRSGSAGGYSASERGSRDRTGGGLIDRVNRD